jgi:methionyl-tRNA formyltransferase
MRILFIGCVESSATLLNELLINKKNICGVVTKKSSGFNSDFIDLSEICAQHNVPVIYYKHESTLQDFVRKHMPDLIYCFGWSHLLSGDVISYAKQCVVGFHPAALPKNRGRHPIIWALVLGLKITASTFFKITPNADEGEIISQKEINISELDTARMLYDKIMETAKKQVLEFTEQFEQCTIKYKKQDDSISNSWRKRNKRDGLIDFRMGAENIYNLVRALSKPYIGAHFECKEQEYKVWSAKVIKDTDGVYDNIEFGKVLKVYSPTSFLVKTGNNLLEIIECDEISICEGDYL